MIEAKTIDMLMSCRQKRKGGNKSPTCKTKIKAKFYIQNQKRNNDILRKGKQLAPNY